MLEGRDSPRWRLRTWFAGTDVSKVLTTGSEVVVSR